MLAKIRALIWLELYRTFTDRNALLILIVTPLALATIIGLAFSGFIGDGSNDVPIRDIPLAVVNLDEGIETLGNQINNGDIFIEILVPAGDTGETDENVLHLLTDAIALDDPDEARARVDRGDLTAAIIIPPDFSRNLTITPDRLTIEPASIEVYANPAMPISASIVRLIATGIANQIATGNVTIAATIGYLVDQAQQNPLIGLRLLGEFEPDFSPAFDPANALITLETQTVQGEAVTTFNPLAMFGAGVSVMFMMFMAQASANGIMYERQNGTLQRLLATPTPRMVILLGKLAGTFASAVLQLVLLFIFLTLVGSLLSGQVRLIWGDNLLAIALAIGAAALAASGLGALLTALVRTPEQGNVVGTAVILAMSVLGGTFFSTEGLPILQTLRQFTLNYWSIDAFTRLSLGETNIGLHLLVLFGLGAVMFLLGVIIFNRRLDI